MQTGDKSAYDLTGQIVEKEDEFHALLSDKTKKMLGQMREKQLDLSVANEKKAFKKNKILLSSDDEDTRILTAFFGDGGKRIYLRQHRTKIA